MIRILPDLDIIKLIAVISCLIFMKVNEWNWLNCSTVLSTMLVFSIISRSKIFAQRGSNICTSMVEMKVVGIWVRDFQFSLWYNAHVQFWELSVCCSVSCSRLQEGGKHHAPSQRLHFCSFTLIWSYNPLADSERGFSSVRRSMAEILRTLLWLRERSISSAASELKLLKENIYIKETFLQLHKIWL